MIAVLICAHKNFSQLKRLINSLHHPQIDIYLHIDAKVDFSEDEFKNVKLIQNRHDIVWGKVVQVDATISCLKEMSNNNYDHYIFISGQDYPIVSNDYLVNFLKQNKNKEFIQFSKIDISNKKISDRFSKIHISKNKYIRKIFKYILPKKQFINNLIPYFGSSWWILSNEAVIYIINYYEKNNMSSYFKYSLCIDEIIFQTILLNSELKDNVVNDCKRYIDWSDNIKNNTGNPNILTKDDYSKIVNSESFFARKFDENVDSEILDMLDRYRETFDDCHS